MKVREESACFNSCVASGSESAVSSVPLALHTMRSLVSSLFSEHCEATCIRHKSALASGRSLRGRSPGHPACWHAETGCGLISSQCYRAGSADLYEQQNPRTRAWRTGQRNRCMYVLQPATARTQWFAASESRFDAMHARSLDCMLRAKLPCELRP